MDLRDKILFEPPEIGCVLSLTGLPGGGSKIYDRSPYGNIGTIIGATWKRLPSGLWCLSFDGTDDYVDCGTGASLILGTGDFAVEAWVNSVDSPKDDWPVVMARGSTGAGEWMLRLADFGLLNFYGRGANINITGTTDLKDAAWHHCAFVRPGDNGFIYVDGSEEKSGAGIDSVNLDTAISLKVSSNLAKRHWEGYIALPRVYNRALTALEIQNHFQREKHLFGAW